MTTIQGLEAVPKVSANDKPAPIEFPAWKDAQTRKIPKPARMLAQLPHLVLKVCNKDWLVANPIRAPILVKEIIRAVDTSKTHNRSYPYKLPSLDVRVRLPGPNTNAAVMIPGPKERNHFLAAANMFFSLFLQQRLPSVRTIA